jgi:hypothetical protein
MDRMPGMLIAGCTGESPSPLASIAPAIVPREDEQLLCRSAMPLR